MLGQLYNAENCGDERKLPHLDADIEGVQRQGNVALRKADIDQRAGEAKAMQETEENATTHGQLAVRQAVTSLRQAGTTILFVALE